MRESSSRRTKARTAAGLGLAVLVVVGWLLVRALPRSPDSKDDRVVPPASRETRGSEATPPPPQIERGSRVAEPVAAAEAPPATVASSTGSRDVASIRLVGEIRGPVGENLDDASTRLEIQGPKERRAIPIARGAYVVEGLLPGNYALHCSSPGYFDVDRLFSLDAGQTEHREDVELITQWIVAIRLLTSDGRNLRDRDVTGELPDGSSIDVVATGEPPPDRWSERSFERITRQFGSRYARRWPPDAHLSNDPDDTCSGSLEIRLPPPVHVSAVLRGFVLATTRLDTKEPIATLEIPLDRLRGLRCSLRGRIVNAEDGNPIPNTQVQLTGKGGTNILDLHENGEIRKDGLAPGLATLMIDAPAHGFETIALELSPGVETDVGTIRLGPRTHIRGRFVDEAGHGVRSDGHVVPFLGDDPVRSTEWRMVATLEVDGEGKFEIDGLATRKYVLSTLPSGAFNRTWYLPRIVDLSSGSIEDLVVEVRSTSTVRLHPASPDVRSFAWWILSTDRLLCARGSFPDKDDEIVTLVPGSYLLCAGPEASSARETPFTVGSGTMVVEVGP